MGAEAGNEPLVQATLDPSDVRAVLEAAADVVFSDGVSDDFIEQWAQDTLFLLRARQGSSGISNR
jgi:hypothetical protein